MITEQQREAFRLQLEELESEIMELAEASEETAGTVQLDQARVGRLSRMDALQGQAMSQEVLRRRKVQLVQIRKALLRIGAGNYGECQECGMDITFERLEFKPESQLCIDCANATEK